MLQFGGTKLITNGDMSLTSITSAAQQMTNMMYFSIQCVWSGSPTGTLTVQACNDGTVPTSSSTWSTLGTSSVTVDGTQPGGSPSNLLINSNSTGVPWQWIRLVYTKSGSTGTLNAILSAKGI